MPMKTKIANLPKIPVMGGEGKAGSGATESKMAVVLSPRGVLCLELSLAEMLRQQQSEACLYHGQEVSKKWAEYFFHGKCAYTKGH